MNLLDKLTILSDAAKYDAACTSSGAKRGYQEGKIGCTSTSVAGCCHTFSSDGRCVTLLKVLLSNDCCYNCKYCVNRCTNDTPRATFTPEELAELTIEFYRRNYIEGLFLSSGVLRSPDYTTELMIRALSILRSEYRFNGYIHAKAIPGTSPELVEQLGLLADRLSVNIELPSEAGLKLLAPNKTKQAILRPMTQIRDRAKRGYREGKIGCTSTSVAGCCHTFSSDGRCVTLLKVLLSNDCCYNCKYCVNRCTNDTPRATFTPEELAELTIEFYRRNYIEGLFLSSGVLRSPDYTTELMIRALSILRSEYRFNGYIHAKAIPGTSPELVEQLGLLADRLSVNIELPSEAGLKLLAPNKTKQAILRPMTQIRDRAKQSKQELVKYKHAPRFAPAGQSTQLIVGATKESDLHILNLTQALYDSYRLKRVFYSAYVPVVENTLLPALDTKPPLLREHRLYQADWLLRFYGFRANELLDDNAPDFDPALDPKCCWALRHPEFFPVEVNRADYEALLRVPGIGVVSAKRILVARRSGALRAEDLKKLGVVMKRAQYFLTCGGRYASPLKLSQEGILQNLMAVERRALPQAEAQQLSLFDQVG